MRLLNLGICQFQMTKHDTQRIIKVMCDSPGQLAYCLQPLSAANLAFEAFALSDIYYTDGYIIKTILRLRNRQRNNTVNVLAIQRSIARLGTKYCPFVPNSTKLFLENIYSTYTKRLANLIDKVLFRLGSEKLYGGTIDSCDSHQGSYIPGNMLVVI